MRKDWSKKIFHLKNVDYQQFCFVFFFKSSFLLAFKALFFKTFTARPSSLSQQIGAIYGLTTQIRLVNLCFYSTVCRNCVLCNQAHCMYYSFCSKCVINLMLHETCCQKRVFGRLFGGVNLKSYLRS